MFESVVAYEDQTGKVYFTDVNGQLFIGAELENVDRTVGTIRHWLRVFRDIQDELKKRGIAEVFAIVSSQDRFNFAEFLGFQTANVSFNNKYEVVRKELL